MPAVRTAWLIMLATNAIEYTCGTWGSTYLVMAKGLTPESGAIGLTVYYAGMAMGRFLSGVLSERIKTWKRIWLGIAVVAAAVVILLLPLPAAGAIAALCLIGLGNGAIYPNLIHLTPYNFGKELSQAVMGSQIAFAYIGVMLAPPLVSMVCSLFDMGVYPILLAVLTVLMAVSIAVFARNLKKRGAYHTEV